VLDGDELDKGEVLGRTRMGQDLVFWRNKSGDAFAARDQCPHRWTKLSNGKMVGDALQCPFHGFEFTGSGACTKMPAHPERKISGAMSLTTLPIREAHGFLWLWTGPSDAPDTEPAFFDFAGYSAAGSQLIVPVANSYTRAVENQLDMTHLPFVHAKTIGRFAGSAAMDVQTDVEGDVIRMKRKGTDEPGPEFWGPNIWRLKTGPIYQFLAFVPIDDTHMQYYLRTYQPFATWNPAAWLIGKLTAASNEKVVGEDTPMVEGQPREEVRLGSGEVLVPSDGPSIAYRRWRKGKRREWPDWDKKGSSPKQTPSE
jgi:phenylpropionate dioxygenase-like ring-hydroxylating dioxygenase large terminal subunit